MVCLMLKYANYIASTKSLIPIQYQDIKNSNIGYSYIAIAERSIWKEKVHQCVKWGKGASIIWRNDWICNTKM